ncbi:MAG: outer membrane protein transport protein [bacterium]|nr:MAG: outer membrane protein transport protein [bacterium]
MLEKSIKIKMFNMILLAIFASPCFSQGFSNDNHGTRAIGQANAFTARASDPSAIWYNPAGIIQLEGTQIYLGGNGLIRNPEYHSQFYQDTYTSDNRFVISPHIYLSHQLSKSIWVGLGFSTPINYLQDWGDDPVNHAVRASDDFEVHTHVISPCLSFKFHKKISIGLGLHYQMSNIKLVKWDRIEIENLAQQELGITVTDYYLQSEYRLSNKGLTFFGGIQARISEEMLLAFAYQGGRDIESTGTLDFKHKDTKYTDLDPLVRAAFPDADVVLNGRTNVHQFTFGLAVILSKKFECEVNYNHKLWSQLKSWKYSLSEPILLEDLTYTDEGEAPWNWMDSGSLRLGSEYHVSPTLDARAGFSINSSPIPDKWLMSAVPESKHWDIHLGAGYKINKWKIDIGYVHKFYTKRANLDWYGMMLRENQGSLFAISLGKEI